MADWVVYLLGHFFPFFLFFDLFFPSLNLMKDFTLLKEIILPSKASL